MGSYMPVLCLMLPLLEILSLIRLNPPFHPDSRPSPKANSDRNAPQAHTVELHVLARRFVAGGRVVRLLRPGYGLEHF